MKLHVKYTETYPDTLPEFSFDMEEGELDEEDFNTIMKKVTEAVSAPSLRLSGHILENPAYVKWRRRGFMPHFAEQSLCVTITFNQKDGAN